MQTSGAPSLHTSLLSINLPCKSTNISHPGLQSLKDSASETVSLCLDSISLCWVLNSAHTEKVTLLVCFHSPKDLILVLPVIQHPKYTLTSFICAWHVGKPECHYFLLAQTRSLSIQMS